ncbi:hypothetical protein EDD85DRAFT_784194 [Armillaria nabsnona]|nr:hypothetical protein EDD85DRAFT_784194 [Armillaria nabsnona]
MTRTSRVASSTRHGFHVKRQNGPGIPESKNGWNPKFDILTVSLTLDETVTSLTTDDDGNPAAATAKRLETAFLCSHTVLCGISRFLETMECTSGLLPILTEATAALQLGVTYHDFSDIESVRNVALPRPRFHRLQILVKLGPHIFSAVFQQHFTGHHLRQMSSRFCGVLPECMALLPPLGQLVSTALPSQVLIVTYVDGENLVCGKLGARTKITLWSQIGLVQGLYSPVSHSRLLRSEPPVSQFVSGDRWMATQGFFKCKFRVTGNIKVTQVRPRPPKLILPIMTLDSSGRPWGSILVGLDREPGSISTLNLVPLQGSPTAIYNKRRLSDQEELPGSIISFIQSCDTASFDTTYTTTKDDVNRLPSHVDFSGNRIVTSLGNVKATALTFLTLVSFMTGNIPYVTGRTRNHIGRGADKIMKPFSFDNLLDKSVQRSPYSLPVRYLVEKSAPVLWFNHDSLAAATLKVIVLHAIATFTWESSVKLCIISGQAIILNFSGFLGQPGPTSIDDDRILTWTVLSSHLAPTRILAYHPREAWYGGLASAVRRHVLVIADDTCYRRCVELHSKRVALFAGGIGVTPFLSMLGVISGDGWDIVLVLSTREPDLLFPLITKVAEKLMVLVDEPVLNPKGGLLGVTVHRGRVMSGYLIGR